MAKKIGVKTIAQNRKARHDFFVEESVECGIELKGTEVKSMRQGRVNLKESYAIVKNGEVFVQGMHISPYEQGNIFNTDPLRPKRLLLHKSEIRKLELQVMAKGTALIPLGMYWKKNRVKVRLGLGKGKAEYDKRNDIRKRDAEEEVRRAMSYRQKNR